LKWVGKQEREKKATHKIPESTSEGKKVKNKKRVGGRTVRIPVGLGDQVENWRYFRKAGVEGGKSHPEWGGGKQKKLGLLCMKIMEKGSLQKKNKEETGRNWGGK